MNAREDHPARWRPHALTLKDHTNASVRLDIDILEIPVKVVFFFVCFYFKILQDIHVFPKSSISSSRGLHKTL